MGSPPKIRVLVCDDSAVIRRIVVNILTPLAELQLVGFASDGRFAIEMIESLKPHVVVLDIMMPELDGLGVLAAARARDPLLPIILFTQLSLDAASAGVQALSSGTTEYVAKPSAVGPPYVAFDAVREELRAKVLALGRVALQRETSASDRGSRPGSSPRHSTPLAVSLRTDIVAIATSTGGPEALHRVLSALPADFPVPIVIVQHMPPLFTAYLAGGLDKKTALTVREAIAGATLRAGDVWIAPGDFHVEVERVGPAASVLKVHQGPRENSCRPAADVLIRSVAQAYGARGAAVVLTGMGRDGMRGCEQLSRAGGHVIAQDEESSIVWGMPGAVVDAALANEIVPLVAVAGAIERTAWRGRERKGRAEGDDGDRPR